MGYALQYSWDSLVAQMVKDSCNERDHIPEKELGLSYSIWGRRRIWLKTQHSEN